MLIFSRFSESFPSIAAAVAAAETADEAGIDGDSLFAGCGEESEIGVR
jgi:hypothetical protein